MVIVTHLGTPAAWHFRSGGNAGGLKENSFHCFLKRPDSVSNVVGFYKTTSEKLKKRPNLHATCMDYFVVFTLAANIR